MAMFTDGRTLNWPCLRMDGPETGHVYGWTDLKLAMFTDRRTLNWPCLRMDGP